MKKKKVIQWLLGAALAALLLWLFVPQSIYTAMDVPEGSVRRGCVAVLETVFEGTEQDTRFYQVNTEDLDGDILEELLSILEENGFRPDLRNLLPWKTGDLSASGQKYIMDIDLIWGSDPERAVHIVTLEPETFGINAGNGFRVFHPADPATREKLYQFVKIYGKEQD